MALKGNLRDFPITQLLNLIKLAKKTGTLIVDGPTDSVWVYFRDGRLAYAQMGQEENGLCGILYKANKLNASQYRAILERSGKMSDKALGLMLINANYLSQSDILSSLQAHYCNLVHRLFAWKEGYFRFENDLPPPEDRIAIRLGLENLIIEGSRRMQEWEQLQDEIPSLDMALKFTDRPGTNLKKVNLSVEEWRVVSYVNPKNSIRRIARTIKMDDLDIRRIIYGLLQAGLVELVQPEGSPMVRNPSLKSPASSVEEQKSLVQRIINRIRSL